MNNFKNVDDPKVLRLRPRHLLYMKSVYINKFGNTVAITISRGIVG